jgi:endoglucanase
MFQLGKVLVFLALFAAFSFAQGPSGPVPYHGRMKAEGNKLIGEISGTPVQVRGMSFYWSCPMWAADTDRLWSAATVDAMVDGWKVEVLRAAMAANDATGCGGDYQHDKTKSISRVKTVVNRAIERDIYVLIDWHSHKAHQQQDAVINFFVNEMAEYHNVPNVIFEIYNEPLSMQWSAVKTYSQAVVDAIRGAGANNLILIGTTHWDQEPDAATASPVNGKDLAYVLHFYAATHTLNSTTANAGLSGKTFRTAATNSLNNGYPLFVSEWGTVKSDGAGAPDVNSSDAWHAFMDEHKISSCMWQISNLAEGSSIFTSGFNLPASGSDAAWTNQNNMSANGKYIFSKLTSYAPSADWRNPPPVSSSSLDISSSSSSSVVIGGQSSSSKENQSSSSEGKQSSSSKENQNSSSSSDGSISPISISKIANGPVRVHAASNAIVLENLPNNAKIEVYNLRGKIVYSQFSTLNSQFIPVQTKGLYITKVNKEVFYVPIR